MEDKEHFETLLKALRKPQNGKKLLQVLVNLRKQVNSPNHHTYIQSIKDNNCLKLLVGYIRYDGNLKVVDLALSILGNCCMNTSVIKETINELNILHNLNRVLDKHKKDSIQGRVFRILGNLCDGYEALKLIEKEPAIVDSVINYLINFSNENEPACEIPTNAEDDSKSKTTVATVSMALRFIRKLIMRDTFNILVDEHRLINTVGLVLIKSSNDWLLDNKEVVLINDVLKIIQILTSSNYNHYDIIAKLKSTKKGDALNSLGNIILLHPDKIINLILKFAKVAKYQSDLPIEAIISNLLNAVKINLEKPNILHKQYLESINNLMNHIGFHEKLKCSNNINLLVKLFEDFPVEDDYSIQCCIYICSILSKCKYNEYLVRSQLHANIITIIINKLEMITGRNSNKIIVDNHEMKKKFRGSYDRSKKFKRNSFDEDKPFINSELNKSTDRCASPSSCSDISSNGPFSPVESKSILFDDSDSDDYSPLCSENEYEDDFKESIPEDDMILSETEDNRPVLNADQLELRHRLIEEINSLLKIYCNLKVMYQPLANPKLITLLMNIVLHGAINDYKCDSTFSVVLTIARTRDFLITLMLSGFLNQVYEVKDTKHGNFCSVCQDLETKTVELLTTFLHVGKFECIKGDIAYILLGKGKEDLKIKMALSIPYVYRDNLILNKFLVDCGGLNILIKLLKDQSNTQLQEKTLKAICTLATDSLKIKNPVNKKIIKKQKTSTKEDRIAITSYQISEQCANIVTFNLDDGTSVKADREALNEKSDYFSTLLSGQFIESEQTEISLRNVSKDSLNCLLQLLNLNIKLSNILEFDYTLETILDVISLTDRFLLSDLNYALICHVEQLITKNTVPVFYKWAIESGTNIMRIESVAFALVGDIPYKERLDMFHVLFNLGYFYELIEDVEKLIIQFL